MKRRPVPFGKEAAPGRPDAVAVCICDGLLSFSNLRAGRWALAK
jgi:hypothetical protein